MTSLAYAELAASSNFSFLHGASHGSDLVARALELGLAGLGIADRNTVAGVVRAWDALRRAQGLAEEAGLPPLALRLVTGARLVFADGTPDILAYPATRVGWGRLCRLLSLGNLRADKGDCVLRLDDLLAHLEGLLLIVLPQSTRREEEGVAREVATILPDDLGPIGAAPFNSGEPFSSSPSPQRRLGSMSLNADFPLADKAMDPSLRWGDEGGNVIPFPSRLREGIEGGKQARGGGSAAKAPPPPTPPASGRGVLSSTLATLRAAAPGCVWLGVAMTGRGSDRRRLARFGRLADAAGVPLLAHNDVLYATPEDRPLQDILTCIRLGRTIDSAGRALEANAERHLKPAETMAALFADQPEAIAETIRFLDLIAFDLAQLQYEYPHEPVPEGWKPHRWLQHLAVTAARVRWPEGVPRKVLGMLAEEFRLIRRQNIAYYFLTVHDVVQFARTREKPILCQGRGSAANSMVCYLLGITSVDPAAHNLLFSRFLSDERNEPPDIDVDFEHERREEVMQYIYARYGRHRAGIVATVIHYRSRSAVREVGKALGLTDDVTSRLVSTVWGSFATTMDEARYAETGFSLDNPEIERLNHFVGKLLAAPFPRHLSQHVGGFVLSERRLDEIVPIHHAAMDGRTFIEWDKDDIDALRLMKVDVLALGMLTCIAKAFDLIRDAGGPSYELDSVPSEQSDVYDMLCKGDSVGVFQVESRAQMNMLPRLRPRVLYDLVVQVAIVRPGPIQGDMVHPYLRRRTGVEEAEYPSPSPEHGPANELRELLGKTYGVPLFQEQAMKLAIVAAGFTGSESNQLRRSMATFRKVGGMDNFKAKLIGGMTRRGYEEAFAQRCYRQIEGFGSYGFPESHALSFARLVYVSSYLKKRYPAAFCAALLNSQPMGFYAPAQIVRDAREHGVEVREVDVSYSGWDNRLEDGAVRLGLRQIDGLKEDWAKLLPARSGGRGTARAAGGGGASPHASRVTAFPLHHAAHGPPPHAKHGEELAPLSHLPTRALRLLADADAFRSLGLDRRQALWEVRRIGGDALPLFAAANARELGDEEDARLPAMPLSEHVAADYQTTRLSLKAHPMHFLRALFTNEGVLSAAAMAALPDGRRAKVAGVVLVRQRPGEGKAIFVTLEDETGVANILLWARDFEKYRRQVMASRLMECWGVVQKSPEGVVHLMVSHVADRTAELGRLSEDHHTNQPLARADVFEHPQHPRSTVPRGSHPRDVRVLPASRDFH